MSFQNPFIRRDVDPKNITDEDPRLSRPVHYPVERKSLRCHGRLSDVVETFGNILSTQESLIERTALYIKCIRSDPSNEPVHPALFHGPDYYQVKVKL